MNTVVQLSNHLFFPFNKISEVPIFEIQLALINVFKVWGIPKWIKVDNGRPFGDPKLEIIPPLALWLIALGIQVIWNKPRTPQQNTIVERSQGVMANWTEFEKAKDSFDLQVRLWKEADFHNYHFPIRRLNRKKRIEVFPKLMFTGRTWKPNDFNLKRVLKFLENGSWERKVSSIGQISFYNHRFSIGLKYKHQSVCISLDATENQWKIFNSNGQLIKSISTPFNKKSIWNLLKKD